MTVFHVLFIDSYDSFTYNIVRLIEQQEVVGYDSIHVTTIHNDTFEDVNGLHPYLKLFDCILVGPGPGNPVNGINDVGIIDSLFCDDLAMIPMFGICLGFQAMCYSENSEIGQLSTIKHGQVYDITWPGNVTDELFDGLPKTFKSTRYHSLHVLNESDTITPLAYTEDENGSILMAVKVKNKPWYGVQYHPESCCSEYGNTIIKNFLNIAKNQNISIGRYELGLNFLRENPAEFNKLLEDLDKSIDKSAIYTHDESTLPAKNISIKQYTVSKCSKLTLKICDNIDLPKFILASSTINPKRGEWSIIALPNEDSVVFTHYDQLHKTTVHKWRDQQLTSEILENALHRNVNNCSALNIIEEDKSHFWVSLGEFMKSKMVTDQPDIPFIGGLVGILSYEMGYHVYNNLDSNEVLHPDAKLVFIENSIVIDHVNGTLYMISLNNNFPETVDSMLSTNTWLNDENNLEVNWSKELPEGITYDISMPAKEDYVKAFNKCQEYMHIGDSYEICLTTQTKIVPSKYIEPWRIFQTLIQRNPAPFSSYFKFDDIIDNKNENVLCLLSTSPERFLKWDNNSCELRPIKGTVKKGPEMDLKEATRILKTPKEFGENLMILDLIRNDLFELLKDVKVEEFMTVEEYATVYQLVSVVKGYGLSQSPRNNSEIYKGLDIFKHSLPAGSMTGAPKKITVELLQKELEEELNQHVSGGVRGIYSGVTGYWSVNDNGDWSVNIRCMYSYDNGQKWQIGAGGAITVLSTLEGELDEMYTKLESALQVFT